MFPITMTYQTTESDTALEVDVYSFDHTHDTDGNIVNTLITAWVPKNNCWLTAPVWCFKPINKKLLKEGD